VGQRDEGSGPSVEATTPGRSWRRGVGVGIGAGLAAAIAVAALTYAVAAIPLFLLAQVAPDGRDRPEFRTALVVALVVGATLGAAVGTAVGIWAGRGGRLPTDRSSFLED
jgi:hypothetical protein